MGLKNFRKQERYSLQQVADYLGTFPSSIWKIEKGIQNPTIREIKLMAKLYKVSIKQIVDAWGEQDE